MLISAPCVVSLSWRLEDAHGNLIDHLDEPVEFFYGGDDLLAKVEEVIAGQGTSYEATLHLEPEHAFGEYEAGLVFFEARDLFPEAIATGMQFEGPPEGSLTPDMPADKIYTVTEVYDSHVVLDGNHPLAGIALVLQLKVCGVREADEEETANRSVDKEGVSLLSLAPPSPHLH
ncbi:FKBP-type peptidyl-prolyl cis-trans isomerase [Leptothrix discophora]|uniref:peptidylprolyl isomerase n=1 Tax=Leptothrix discophora TaxID=89 RepID=A0ABT9G274_LEPDI|nr:peptidylprolyl isomerase [Leptothrix discophora]MDP4300576.1 peptidylprolyl isomerase [Leptothrix discophora]